MVSPPTKRALRSTGWKQPQLPLADRRLVDRLTETSRWLPLAELVISTEQPSRGVAPRMVDQGASDEGSINGEAMDILKRMSETLAQARHTRCT